MTDFDSSDRSGQAPADQPPSTPSEALGFDAPPEPEIVERERRNALERIGLAAIAVVMGGLFGVVAVASLSGGEYILAAMAAVGCMMTLVVGGITLLRG